MISKSKFLNSKDTRITFCGIEKKNLKHYLKKYKFSKVLVVRPDEKPDYVIMTNRVNWSVTNSQNGETCFKSYKGKTISTVSRYGLILSKINKF